MGLLDRVGSLVQANLNEVLDRAEDPEVMLRQIIREMDGQLIQVKSQVAVAIASGRTLQAHCQENQVEADKWEKNSELAARKGDDELAKEAIARQTRYQALADGFKAQYNTQHQQVTMLKDALSKLENKIEDAKTNKDLLISRSRQAKATKQVQGTLAGVGTNTRAFEAFDRMKDKVSTEEAEAQAVTELAGNDLDERFKKLGENTDVDEKLVALKAKIAAESDPSASRTRKTKVAS